MRIVFMGTPDFAAVSLEALVAAGHEVCGVLTQPDKPRNRNKVTFSPVKEYALSQGLTVYQPTKLRDGSSFSPFEPCRPTSPFADRDTITPRMAEFQRFRNSYCGTPR